MAENDADSVVSASKPPTIPSSSSSTNLKKAENHQMMKLKEANAKYKSLLKMAKERIQTQAEELGDLQAEVEKTKNEMSNNESHSSSSSLNNGSGSTESAYFSYKYDVPATSGLDATSSDSATCSIVRVCQRIKVESSDDHNPDTTPSDNNDTSQQQHQQQHQNHQQQQQQSPPATILLWALIEYELTLPETPDTVNTFTPPPSHRFLRWRSFPSPLSLSDHIRRTSGEPIHLPPYSLTPTQSQTLESNAHATVTSLTEEFRRFRVKSEVARRQADATIRSLQNSNVGKVKRRMEGEDLEDELAQARVDHGEVVRLRAEGMEVEARWKEAYDVLVVENRRLRGSGSEALLAAQWRQRYEGTLREREELETLLEMEREKGGEQKREKRREDAGKYESKYKDLKESFRMYRKKAKEIFEAQQRGEVAMLDIGDKGAEDAKISYLRNLMVNYLSSDPGVRDHMEGAIGTVLKFSNEDSAKISKQKLLSDSSWFK